MNLIEQINQYNHIMENLLGKEKWESLTTWEKMCEIASLNEFYSKNIHDNFFMYIF